MNRSTMTAQAAATVTKCYFCGAIHGQQHMTRWRIVSRTSPVRACPPCHNAMYGAAGNDIECTEIPPHGMVYMRADCAVPPGPRTTAEGAVISPEPPTDVLTADTVAALQIEWLRITGDVSEIQFKIDGRMHQRYEVAVSYDGMTHQMPDKWVMTGASSNLLIDAFGDDTELWRDQMIPVMVSGLGVYRHVLVDETRLPPSSDFSKLLERGEGKEEVII